MGNNIYGGGKNNIFKKNMKPASNKNKLLGFWYAFKTRTQTKPIERQVKTVKKWK